MVAGLFPRDTDLEGVALVAWRAPLSQGFAASLGLTTTGDVSFITLS